MDLNIFVYTEKTVRINTDKKFCIILAKWLAPYVKKEVKKAAIEYECVSWREAFDQVLTKELSIRADKFLIYQELIDMDEDLDLAKINEET